MSRTKNADELYALIIEDTYGELASRIFAILLRRGRLSIPHLAQHTRLPARNIRHGLVVLIQQNLVYHFYDGDTNTTFYEANHVTAYSLLQAGRILEVFRTRYGAVAKELAQNLLLLGNTKVADLLAAYESREVVKPCHNGAANGNNGDLSNGVTNGTTKASDQLDDILLQLLQDGFVEPVTENMFRSPADLYNILEKELMKEKFGGSTKGTKEKVQLKHEMRHKLRELRSENKAWTSSRGSKRVASDPITNGGKRQKLSNGNGNSHDHEDVEIIDRDLVIRINYEKCTVALRSRKLVDVVAHDIGEITSQVYAELLRFLERKIPRCQADSKMDDPDEDDGPTITTMELCAAIDKSVNVALGIGKAESDQIDTKALNKRNKKRKADEAEAESGASDDEDEESEEEMIGTLDGSMDIDEDSDSPEHQYTEAPALKSSRKSKVTFQDKLPKPSQADRVNRMTHLRNHLNLLAEYNPPFVTKCGNNGQGEWTVDFVKLVDYMRRSEMDTIIGQNFQPPGQRIARILRQYGKLDEKTLQTSALLKQKDVRTKLVEMQMAGFVDIQEVPKDSSRAPGRTIFLWYFDTARVTAVVLDRIYKSMSRAYETLDVEKTYEKDVLALAERSDVRENEEALLQGSNRTKLNEVREKEVKILAQIMNFDELVGVFRDY